MTVASPYARALARMPVSTRVHTLLGSSTHVWEYGAAGQTEEARREATTALVVVHGFRGDHHGLEPVIAQLDEPGTRIVAPDLPGFGESTPLAATHDVEGYAAWTKALVASVRAESPAARIVVIGHSFGSIVVSAALAGEGDGGTLEADDVVLINPIAAPALAGPRGVMTRLAIVYYQFSAAVPEKLGFAILRSGLVVQIMSSTMAKTKDKSLRRWIHDQHHRYFSAFATRSVVLDAFRASVSHDVSEYAARITAPTLMIAADKDDITPVAAQYDVQNTIPSAELVVIEGVGHLIHYERPVEAADAIRSFLARS
ncbi:alpha/beta fold hydrolase [Herbiconiux liukaitaii]|uniref:alpha/beta fold hydrolase n=1 Tax=Herbiconiux liukaitaii TaxID=3342799 RepID=UPI0035B97B43